MIIVIKQPLLILPQTVGLRTFHQRHFFHVFLVVEPTSFLVDIVESLVLYSVYSFEFLLLQVAVKLLGGLPGCLGCLQPRLDRLNAVVFEHCSARNQIADSILVLVGDLGQLV
jgi:hypothetical protein